MKVNGTGFEFYLTEALKMTAKTDFGSFGEYIAERNRMSDELVEEIDRQEPVQPEKSDKLLSTGDFLEMSVSMRKS
ncbi:hypothetical protein EP073_02100 [Geovibrio thiophilus]|uniref:Uncharacterized protein n=1 Tax=Geovibrio thiophilus TaxID=139438 RepID=A0A3R5X1J9_9BACT|nr:hypothetical protein [Geovibrio thiophilus]QAR32229.1 hypothetical protein EP073_02100 [Geovibrio thiophilus]